MIFGQEKLTGFYHSDLLGLLPPLSTPSVVKTYGFLVQLFQRQTGAWAAQEAPPHARTAVPVLTATTEAGKLPGMSDVVML